MQKATSALQLKAQHHRLIRQQEMIQFKDPHCPSNQMLESGSCWIRNEALILELGEEQQRHQH
ncbi:MAG: hypothetical protein OIF55_06515 [Amphritea sp.]|nr:hypothetical protein [Amphritea sp.]